VRTLRGRLVELREFSIDDADAMLVWSGDPAVTHYLTWDPGDRDRALSFVRYLVTEAARQPRQSFELAMVERATGEVVGAAGMRVRDWQNRRADVGYVLRRDRWGRGYTTEAVGLLLAFGFELGMHRIEASCHPDNRGSSRVMEKNGMRYEGRLRDTHYVRGEWRDSLLYAIIAGEAPD
jgi:RimJ/RimL family protein N-acetyltransferase